MQILSVYDDAFRDYGRVLSDVPAELTEPVVEAMRSRIELPADTAYDPSIPALEELNVAPQLGELFFGGMPFQFGCVRGHNTKLNCLEYHRSSEFNLGTDDFILLLARECEMELDEDGKPVLDTAKVKAFRAPAGVLIETFATTFHYTPCHADAEFGFRVLVALPRGTNEPLDAATAPLRATVAGTADANLLWARNKYLLAHADAPEAAAGAVVGLRGENWDLAAN